MRASVVLLVLAFGLPLGARTALAQDPTAISGVKLPFDSVRFTYKADGTTFEVAKDGHFVLTKPDGARSEGVLSPTEWFSIASAAGRAPFATEDGKTLTGKTAPTGPEFKLEARTGDRTLSVSGQSWSDGLGPFWGLVRALEDGADSRISSNKLFGIFPTTPRLKGSLEGTIGDTKIDVDGITRKVKIVTPTKTLEATLTEDEVRTLAKAMKSVDRSGFAGDVGAFQPAGAKPTSFRFVVYEAFRQYLLAGNVGLYGEHGEHDDVGALVVTLQAIQDRVEHPPVVAPVERKAEDASEAAPRGLFASLREGLARVFGGSSEAPVAPPSRTRGLNALLEERIGEAHDRARGAGEAER